MECVETIPPAVQQWEVQASAYFERHPGVGAVVSLFPFQFRQNEDDFLRNGWADLRFKRHGFPLFGPPSFTERLSGRPMAFRKDCLREIGNFDPDMKEWADADRLLRCRQRGWRVLCVLNRQDQPLHLQENAFSRRSEKLQWPRVYYLAKYFPFELVRFLGGEEYWLRSLNPAEVERGLLRMLRKCVESNEIPVLSEFFPLVSSELSRVFGEKRVNRLWGLFELEQGYREKIEIGIYDHALQTPGGGQKYACTIASILQRDYKVTLLSNKPVTTQKLMDWYGLDLNLCRVKIIKIPFFEQKGRELIDQGAIPVSGDNPFDVVAEESKRYDIFVNVNMLTKVRPLSGVSVFLCHFPDSKRGNRFYVDEYNYLIANSLYTIKWLQKRWNMRPSTHIYPPVDMLGEKRKKEGIILSVARFDQTGSKRQDALVEVFEQLCQETPEIFERWELVLAGGTFGRNPFLQKLKRRVAVNPKVRILENISLQELKELYAKASIFWHACGLDTDVPERIEHFGMATVEAMQNGCVPVVINKGGQKEIVEHDFSGFLFDDLNQLRAFTKRLVTEPALLKSCSENAVKRGLCFTKERFENSVRSFFSKIKEDHFCFQSTGRS